MKIEVTAEDIAVGVAMRSIGLSSETCPIAQAARRAWPAARIGATVMDAGGGMDEIRRYRLPPEARNFIMRFHTGQPLEPFTFEIED